jgi:aspartate aminotransferase
MDRVDLRGGRTRTLLPERGTRSTALDQPPMTVAANLALNERITERVHRGEPILHMGFGESRLPLPAEVAAILAEAAHLTDYGPVAGREAPRAAVSGYFDRRGLPTCAADVVLAPGSKPLLLALVAAVPGDVVLARPAWVSYAPQARLLGRRVIDVPIPAEAGGVPDPDLLPIALAKARAAGADPRILILTAPDNPTGTTAGPELVRRVVGTAEREDLLLVSDEIYRDVLFDEAAPYLSPGEVAPDRTVVVTGLSKSLSLGGWRIGAARFPADPAGRALRDRVLGVASQIWSNAPGPMQAVAEYAFDEPAGLVAHRRASTRLHAAVTRAVHAALADAGALVRVPTGGFYVYPDLAPLAHDLARLGVRSSHDLEEYLLDAHGIAVLGGHHGGDDRSALRFRAATSLLHGRTDDERWAALTAEDPLALPWVADAIERLTGLLPAIRHAAPRSPRPR